MRRSQDFSSHSTLTLNNVHLLLKLCSVSGVPGIVWDSALVESKVGAILIHFLRHGILVLGAEGRNSFWDKAVLLEEELDTLCGCCTHGEPVADPVLVDCNLSRHGFLAEGSPDAHMLEVFAVQLLLLALHDDPPVGMSVLTLLE